MTSRPAIDLNCDLGESFGVWRLGDDEALLDVISSANVACGFHAGDPSVLRRVTAQAADRGVVIGAQVSYRDLAGFGRRFVDVDPGDLISDVIYQIAALAGFAGIAGTRVRYVRPHGALYNTVGTHRGQAEALVAAVRSYDPGLLVLGQPGSEWLEQAAAAGLTTVPEAFADRAYTPGGALVSRRRPGAVLHEPASIAARSVRMATEGTVETIDGSVIAMRPRSLCVHGDTPGAAGIVRQVRGALAEAGVAVRPFA